MEHGQALTPATTDPHHDPGDFVAEEARIEKAQPNYIGVFIVLAVLTVVEVSITTAFPVKTVGTVPILLALTLAKGLLVVLYYMHLKFDNRIYSIFFGAGVFAFALPFVIAMILLLAPPHLESARGENGGGGGAGGPTPAVPAGPPITFNVEGGEFFFNPDAVSPNAGQNVRVTMKNIGDLEHTFAVASKPKSQDAEPWVTNDGKVLFTVASGGSARGTFSLPAPGEYVFYCSIPGHAQSGMHGTVIVK